MKPLEVAVNRMREMSVGMSGPPSAFSRDDEPPLQLGELRPDYTIRRPIAEGAASTAADDGGANANSPPDEIDVQENVCLRALRSGYMYFKDVLRNNQRYQVLTNCYTGIVILQFLQFAVILLFYGAFTRSSDDTENVTNYLQSTTVLF